MKFANQLFHTSISWETVHYTITISDTKKSSSIVCKISYIQPKYYLAKLVWENLLGGTPSPPKRFLNKIFSRAYFNLGVSSETFSWSSGFFDDLVRNFCTVRNFYGNILWLVSQQKKILKIFSNFWLWGKKIFFKSFLLTLKVFLNLFPTFSNQY